MSRFAVATLLFTFAILTYLWPEFDGIFHWGVALTESEGRILSGVYSTGAFLALINPNQK
tara:strand:- start:20 stop:199 length:180 start_codon:yes stop_codon:yes gene_type:complete